MATSVRDVIINALSRANICSKRQAAPGYLTESAFELLKGIAAKYSKDNLLQFLRRELYIERSKVLPKMVIGEYALNDEYSDYLIFDTLPQASSQYLGRYAFDKETRKIYIGISVPTPSNPYAWGATNQDPNEVFYSCPDIELKNVASISEVYARNGRDDYNNDYPLGFVSYEDYRNPMYGYNIYTWQSTSDKSIELKIKEPAIVTSTYGFVVVYNVAYSFDIDSILKIPDNYIELFTAALVYALAIKYPKLDAAQVQRLKAEKDELESNIAIPTRANKLILRNNLRSTKYMDMRSFLSGSFIM